MTTHKASSTGVLIENFVPKKTYEEMHLQWKLHDFSKLFVTGDRCESPTFSINDILWHLSLYPRSLTEFMCLYIQAEVKNKEYSLKYKFMLKKSDDSTVQLNSGIVEKNKSYNDNGSLRIETSKILQQKSDLVPQDVLTIICIVKREIVQSIQSTTLEKSVPIKLIKLHTLSENFKDLMQNTESCDATLNVQGKEYKAHRAVLIARSSVFASMFLHETTEKQTGDVNITDCDPESFGEFLKFLYCGKFEDPTPFAALHLYETSDKYAVQELKAFCLEYLMENLSVENVCDVMVLADKYEEVNLLNTGQMFFNKNLSKIFQTAEWDGLVKDYYRLSKRLLTEMSLKVKVVE